MPSPTGGWFMSVIGTTMLCLLERIRPELSGTFISEAPLHRAVSRAPGSEPEYSFHWHGGGDMLYLFEAPIDMLSFISMFKHCWKSQSYAASCGVSDKVLWQMLKDGPHIKKIYICFDNDEPGQQAAQRISRELTEKNIWHETYPPENKDWNEDLLALRKGRG